MVIVSTRRFAHFTLHLSLLVWIASHSLLVAQSNAELRIDDVRVGVEKTSKVGCWARVQIEIAGGESQESVRIEVDAADSDGATVTYANKVRVTVGAGEHLLLEQYVKLGRMQGEIEVRLLSDDGLIDSKKSRLRGVGFSTQPWMVSLFGEVGLKRWVRRRKFDEDNRPVISTITSAADLPNDPRGWDGVGRITLATGDGTWKDVTDKQWNALDAWVRRGGQLVFTVGRDGEAVSQHRQLSAWLPGQYSLTETVKENPSLEDFASAEQVLPPVIVTQLTDVTGSVEGRFGSRGRNSGPAIIRRTYGFGVILFCAIDLEQDPVVSWEARDRFIEQMLDLRRADWKTSQSSNHGVKYGHTEMSGQLRATLDSYQPEEGSSGGVRVLAFSVIAVFLVLYLLVIGPGDFFFLQRVVGRMEWTWVSFPLVLLVSCGLILGVNSWRLGGVSTRLNQVDVVDLDLVDGTIRGTTWASLFSAQPGTFDLSAETDCAVLNGDIQDPTLLWQGHPGKGLGGFQAVSSVRWADSHYQISTDDQTFRIQQMPLAAASSRSLIANWHGKFDSNDGVGDRGQFGIETQLRENLTGKLEGRVKNPLSEPLVRPLLVHKNKIYRLGEQLPAGEDVDIGEPDRALEWELTRRKTYDATRPSSDTITDWDPLEKDVRRLMEVMLHYKAAGGSAYTQLGQRYQSEIDLSQHLELGRAILWGEVERPAVRISVNDQDATENAERHWAFYRVVLPVETEKRP